MRLYVEEERDFFLPKGTQYVHPCLGQGFRGMEKKERFFSWHCVPGNSCVYVYTRTVAQTNREAEIGGEWPIHLSAFPPRLLGHGHEISGKPGVVCV